MGRRAARSHPSNRNQKQDRHRERERKSEREREGERGDEKGSELATGKGKPVEWQTDFR